MSFARFALRTAALHALHGQTLVGDNVRDSDFGAIDVGADGSLRTDQDRPFVLIYTDDSDADEDLEPRSLRQNGALDIVFEFGIASPMTEMNEETGESTVYGVNVPATDAAFELTLDMIDRQIVAALTRDGDWPDIWRSISDRVVKIERRRAATTEDGIRIAARQMRVRLACKPDPVMGQPLTDASVWARFMAALQEADAVLHGVALTFLGTADAELTYEHVRAARGERRAEGRALGYGPFHDGEPGFTISEAEISGGHDG